LLGSRVVDSAVDLEEVTVEIRDADAILDQGDSPRASGPASIVAQCLALET
jgi:hypothetical protein